jgi:hypothetical protein
MFLKKLLELKGLLKASTKFWDRAKYAGCDAGGGESGDSILEVDINKL